MLTFTKGNIFQANVEALVNPVNTMGIAGAGLAKQFRDRFPAAHALYQQHCHDGQLKIGAISVVAASQPSHPRLKFIIYFPTKEDWWKPSKVEYIRWGMIHFVDAVQSHKIRSVALPALGCGLGGLRWDVVRPVIEESCIAIPEVDVRVFEPG